MSESTICPICGESASIKPHSEYFSVDVVRCTICGRFTLSDNFNLAEEDKIKLRYYFYTLPEKHENRLKVLDIELKTQIFASFSAPKNLPERVDRILLYLSNITQQFYGELSFDDANAYRELFCADESELLNITNIVLKEELQYINKYNALTVKGWERVVELQKTNINSTQGFVAMWFSDKNKEVRKRIENAIRGKSNVGSDDVEYGAGYTARIIDTHIHDNYIPAEIIAEIRRSKFVVADFTGCRGGVYYEAGFAEGFGIPVIYTCKKEWFEDIKDSKGEVTREGVHFDLKQKQFILWEDDKLNKFQRELTATIGARVGFN